MTRRFAAVALVALAAFGASLPEADAQAPAAAPAAIDELTSATARFVALSPRRVLDTRSGVGVPVGKALPGSTVVLPIAKVSGVAATATALSINITATDATAPGYVQAFPTGAALIGASSNLNVESAGQTIAGHAIVPIGRDGSISLYTDGGAHLIVDVFGYFVPDESSKSGRFQAAAFRALDSRSGAGVFVDNPGDTKNCGDFSTWTAANEWFWTYEALYGDVARLDDNADRVACAALPGAPADGKAFRPRDLTRLRAEQTLRFKPALPAATSAAVLNLTVTETSGGGYLQAIPSAGSTALRASSNLNVSGPGKTIANLAIVPVGSDGTITLFSDFNTHVIADVLGYFTASSAPESSVGLYVPISPARLLDTRLGIGVDALSGVAPLAAVPAPGTVSFVSDALAPRVASAPGALFLNVTATSTANAGFVQVLGDPAAIIGSYSNVNSDAPGQTIANSAITSLGPSHRTSIYSDAGAHLIADVAGYFTGAGTPATLLAVGDIASCAWSADEAVADLLAANEGSIALLGDTVYDNGTASEFANCFLPAWRRLLPRIRPAAGNHDYNTPNATPYYATFGARAGDPARGYYSYTLGQWHIVVLNSNCGAVGGCQAGSPQEQWLRADLAAHPARCTLAYWHHPRFSSSSGHGSDSTYTAFWQALQDAGAEVVLSGHDHGYERFAPQTPSGVASANGIRQFVVGTGGAPLYPFTPTVAPASEVRNSTTYGALRLTLRADGYDWQFLRAAGGTFGDTGSAACRG